MQRTILVIEDNEQNLYLSTYLLEESGHHVIQARDGKTGIRMAVQQVPDLILLDIQLPEMDGYAVFRELRALPGLEAVPIVAVTAYAMAGDRERALSTGFSGYIEKPIKPDTFIEDVSGFFEH